MFAGLSLTGSRDKKSVQIIAHKAAGCNVLSVYIDSCQQASVLCTPAFNSSSAPDCNPEIIFGVDAHSVRNAVFHLE